MSKPVILVRDWRTTEAALQAAREQKTSPILITPEDAASFYGAGYLAALQERAEAEFPDVAFELIVDCGDAPGHALACLRSGVKRISMRGPNDKIADIARQMGAQLVRRPT
jgi:fructose/tagatose bisphosphate aldolase